MPQGEINQEAVRNHVNLLRKKIYEALGAGDPGEGMYPARVSGSRSLL